MTPLDGLIREIIALEGPLSIETFMTLALYHPIHGYYRSKDPIGRGGDFITAPEISQMFGELIGVFAAEVWLMMGSPAPFRLIELGPGRGTLMSDALRTLRQLPHLHASLEVHLVEVNAGLREVQKKSLERSGAACVWHEAWEDLPAGPAVILANEFFDCLPVKHYVAQADGWHERLIGLGGSSGDLTFGLSPGALPGEGALWLDEGQRQTKPGSILEIGFAGMALMKNLAARVAREGGALLVIDYGYQSQISGETLQAVKNHEFADPLRDIGEADLTALVDFKRLAQAAQESGALTYGPVSQGSWLKAMGIAERAEVLKRAANPRQAGEIDAALTRLTAPNAMGDLFKVLAVTDQGLSEVPGFDDTYPGASRKS